jgi:hypothetical protein
MTSFLTAGIVGQLRPTTLILKPSSDNSLNARHEPVQYGEAALAILFAVRRPPGSFLVVSPEQ